MRYKLGILGGMGPLATAKLYEMIINKTKASCDQEHLELVVLNNCTIPDRTEAIINNGEDPVAKLNEGIEMLEEIGCEYFVVPCNTAHYFKDQLIMKNIKMIDMIEEALLKIKSINKDARVCVLCTDGTRKSRVYERDFSININYPSLETQKKVMEVIYQTKAGFDKSKLLMDILMEEKKNFDIFLFACTELSIYYDKYRNNHFVIDAMDNLSEVVVVKCGKKLK